MKCYNCGCTLSENNFCTACGADVATYKKIIRLSNMYYNDGLQKAKVRDLSGAVQSLRQSLKCNKNHIEARNLLGLVYFEMGEPVAALSEWVISKNLKSKKNIADDFIQEIQSNPTKLDAINQTIKKYNQALVYCKQGSLDLAVIQLKKVLSINPNLIKGYQLLALLYMNNEEWEKAGRTIAKAEKVDANNTTTLYYKREIERALSSREEISGDVKKKNIRNDVITYQSGNETIIQPLNNPERTGTATVINIVIGMVIGLGIMWYLVLPARIRSEKSDINKNLVEVSNQLTEKSASMDEIQKQISSLQTENEDLNTQISELTGDDGTASAFDSLMEASFMYIDTPEDTMGIADALDEIDQAYVSGNEASNAFKTLYEKLSTDVYAKAATEYMQNGLAAQRKNDYETAVENLLKAVELDPANAEALYNLAQAYRKSEQNVKAEETYQKVISLFPDTQYAKSAKDYLDSGTTANSQGTTTQAATTSTTETPSATTPVVPAAADTNLNLPADTQTVPDATGTVAQR